MAFVQILLIYCEVFKQKVQKNIPNLIKLKYNNIIIQRRSRIPDCYLIKNCVTSKLHNIIVSFLIINFIYFKIL